MPLLSPDNLLLAQPTRWESLASEFKGRSIDSREVILGLTALVCIILAVWLLSYILALFEKRQAYDGPRRLFLSLCRAHRLSWSDAWLLWRVARVQRLRDPARVFVERERLDPVHLPAGLRIHAARLSDLAARLFSGAGSTLSDRAPGEGEQPTGPGPLLPPVGKPSLDAQPWRDAARPVLRPDPPPQPVVPDRTWGILDLDEVQWHDAGHVERLLSGDQD